MENLVKKENNLLSQSFDLKSGIVPNLHEDAKELPIDLSSSYWTPEKEGDSKRCFFQRVENSIYTDEKTGETLELPCVILVSQNEKGDLTTIRNGSKRLVATIEDAVSAGRIEEGTPLIITYLKKEKNSTNSFMSDRWSVKPLIIRE